VFRVSEERSPQSPSNSGELEALMQRYQQADSGAAAMLVNQLSPQLYRFYLAQVVDRALAEDLLQDFWLRIHTARHTYRLGEPILPWMYAIARRVRVDQYRRTRKSSQHEIQSDPLPEIPAHEAQPQTSWAITDLLKTLPAAQREVILLLKASGLSLEEVARATGMSVGAVKQKAHRGYEKLRKLLGGET
jgi:RNA polymerase sigma-70 factor, ECF subfamily